MDSVNDYRWSGVTIVEVVSKNPESVDCCVVAASDGVPARCIFYNT
jgi:hypothetical protein